MKNNSYNFNKRNKFITWLCNYNIANLYFEKSKLETDSFTKISLIDSSLAILNNCKSDLYQCLNNVHTEAQMQITKNTIKDRNLYEENLKHIDFVHSILKSTYDLTYKMNYFSRESTNQVKKFRSQKYKLYTLGVAKSTKHSHSISKEKISELQNKLKAYVNSSDSLTKIINNRISYFNSTLTRLSDNLWNRIKIQDSLTKPFAIGFFYRWLYLLDNYKKPIAEQRNKIEGLKNEYRKDISTEIFIPSDSCSEVGGKILDLIVARNNQVIEATKLLKALVDAGIVKNDSLNEYIKLHASNFQNYICWIVGGSSKLNSVIFGYKVLINKEKDIERTIRTESRSEFDRYKIINKEIVRRSRKFRSVPMHNLRVTSKKKNFIIKYRREYLRSLKLARNKNKK